jgi:hypothetical protein
VSLRGEKGENGMRSCLMAVFGIKALKPQGSPTCMLVKIQITDEKIKFLF